MWFRRKAPVQAAVAPRVCVQTQLRAEAVERAFHDLYGRRSRHDDARDQRVISRIEQTL